MASDEKTMAILVLVINLFIPGLGSIIGKRKEGVWQLVLYVVGLVTSIFFIGIFLILGAWVWGIISGINALKEAGVI